MMNSKKRRFKPTLHQMWKETKAFFKMAWKLGCKPETAWHHWRTFIGTLLTNPKSIRYIGSLAALYVHFGPFSKYVAERIRKDVQMLEREEASRPVPPPAPAPIPEPATASAAAAPAGATASPGSPNL
jgi:hypothetical protein